MQSNGNGATKRRRARPPTSRKKRRVQLPRNRSGLAARAGHRNAAALRQSPTSLRGKLGAETIAPSRSFQMLVDFLTRNAAAMLGGMADPQTGQAYVDLEGAREVIDMLDALREKTRGNLAKADDDLLWKWSAA